MSSHAKNNLLLFFDRPTEPCFMQKGEGGAVFQLPDKYYTDDLKDASKTLSRRFSEDCARTVAVKNIALPDLSLPLQLPYNGQFSLFVPKHRKMAKKLIDIFMEITDLEDLQSVCSFCQLRVNPYLFNYCLSVAILHREDTKDLHIPNFAETFPHKFMDPKVFRRVREVSSMMPTDENRKPIVIPQNYTASDLEPEQRTAYFREDIGLNLHHWHWHLVYPFESSDLSIVNKDRRGELFYYMHQQIIARYNFERLCNNLKRVIPISNFREPIAEGYFPKLDSQVASRAWPPRFAGSVMRDLQRPEDELKVDVWDLETWRDRFRQAVAEMAIVNCNGGKTPLDETTGMDVLGNLMEASQLSLNAPFYGDLHNMGQLFISYCHDPDYSNLEFFGVMGDLATAMRDPAFYRWHAFVDSLFQEYKSKLPPYPEDKLNFPGIEVSSISVQGPRGSNTFSTQWEQSTLELGRGLDFTPRGNVPARFTYLQHDDYTYNIEVTNSSGRGVTGTVRIFMAPTSDENGRLLSFNEKRTLMIELDKFSQSIPMGTSIISRLSTESSVTIPYERTFRNQANRLGDPGSASAAEFDFCGCGWPHHLLIPKGTSKGYSVVLIVVISDWEVDGIEQDTVGSCNDAASYCGIRNRKYPDRRAMGYPFDRPSQATRLRDFLKPNMAVTDCSIQFRDQTRLREQKA